MLRSNISVAVLAVLLVFCVQAHATAAGDACTVGKTDGLYFASHSDPSGFVCAIVSLCSSTTKYTVTTSDGASGECTTTATVGMFLNGTPIGDLTCIAIDTAFCTAHAAALKPSLAAPSAFATSGGRAAGATVVFAVAAAML